MLVITFECRQALVDAMNHMLAHGMGSIVDIGHAALITPTTGGLPIIVDNHVTPREGLVCGTMLGATMIALGIIQIGAFELSSLGGVLVVGINALAGAALGGMIGYWVAIRMGFGFHPTLLNGVAGQLAANQVALIIQAHPAQVTVLQQELVAFKAQLEVRSGRPARYTVQSE